MSLVHDLEQEAIAEAMPSRRKPRDPVMVFVDRRLRERKADRLKAVNALRSNGAPSDDPAVLAVAARMFATICPYSGLTYAQLEAHVLAAAADAVRAKRKPRTPWATR